MSASRRIATESLHYDDCHHVPQKSQYRFSRAELSARQRDLFEAADWPTLTGAAGAQPPRRRLRRECRSYLSSRNERGLSRRRVHIPSAKIFITSPPQ
jgi:hypothetical protein